MAPFAGLHLHARFRSHLLDGKTILGGSWVVIGGVLSPLISVISKVTLLLNLLLTTHEPPSRP